MPRARPARPKREVVVIDDSDGEEKPLSKRTRSDTPQWFPAFGSPLAHSPLFRTDVPLSWAPLSPFSSHPRFSSSFRLPSCFFPLSHSGFSPSFSGFSFCFPSSHSEAVSTGISCCPFLFSYFFSSFFSLLLAFLSRSSPFSRFLYPFPFSLFFFLPPLL